MDLSNHNDNLAHYYARRANEYEKIYYRDDPQRQQEQVEIQSRIKEALCGLNILEVACGTGYWTQFASQIANSITATDVNQEVLKIARYKNYLCPVSFEKADAYDLPYESGSFTGGLVNFWLSHVPKHRIGSFLAAVHKMLNAGARVVMADNMYVEGVGGELVSKEGDENTYKLRTLDDGTQREILKNYFTKEELLQIFKKYDPTMTEDDIFIGLCFWCVTYRI